MLFNWCLSDQVFVGQGNHINTKSGTTEMTGYGWGSAPLPLPDDDYDSGRNVANTILSPKHRLTRTVHHRVQTIPCITSLGYTPSPPRPILHPKPSPSLHLWTAPRHEAIQSILQLIDTGLHQCMRGPQPLSLILRQQYRFAGHERNHCACVYDDGHGHDFLAATTLQPTDHWHPLQSSPKVVTTISPKNSTARVPRLHTMTTPNPVCNQQACTSDHGSCAILSGNCNRYEHGSYNPEAATAQRRQ